MLGANLSLCDMMLRSLRQSQSSKSGGSVLLCELRTSNGAVCDQKHDAVWDERTNIATSLRSVCAFSAWAAKTCPCPGGSEGSPEGPHCVFWGLAQTETRDCRDQSEA